VPSQHPNRSVSIIGQSLGSRSGARAISECNLRGAALLGLCQSAPFRLGLEIRPMKTPIIFALCTMLAFASFMPPGAAEERACRPSLSNLYKCPDTSESPSTSAGPVAPDTSASSRKHVTPVDRTCRPSLSNGYKCPDTSVSPRTPAASDQSHEATPRRTARKVNSDNIGQYATEAQAKAHCAGELVVWANTRSKIYHFSGTRNYGNTKYGAYMCEEESVSAGMRAAKNETHP
jgi:hypothetical protein